jgi:low temperature requirement protein LtrA
VSEQQAEREQRVTSFELFFDLVFVFGFTQVTTVLSDDPTWSGLADGLLILGALWWAWAAYAWLTNTVNPDEGAVWGAMLVAMAAMFVAALAVPEAFGRHGVVFGVAFLVVNVMYLTLYALGARGDRDLLAAILRSAPSALAGAALIIAAGFLDGGLRPLLWLAALLIGLFGPLLAGSSGWRVEPAHFVERHGLIVIIAIGESLIAIGLGARGTGLGFGVIVAAVLGLLVAISFWLAYFDFFTTRGLQLLTDRTGVQRVALARDAYTYLHLPMVTGIVLFAFALKTTLAHVGDELDTIPALALCGGPRALPPRVRRGARTCYAHAPRRAPGRRGRLRSALALGHCRARAPHARAHRRRLGRAPCVRDHLVARGPRADPRSPAADRELRTDVIRTRRAAAAASA